MPYVHYTEQQKNTARMTSIADIIQRQGGTLKRSGSEEVWLDGEQKVTIRGNLWYHQYEQTGGDAIEFVKRFMGKSYPDAMEYLLGGSSGAFTPSAPIERKEAGQIELPEKNGNMRRVYAYLLYARGLSKDVVNVFAHHSMIYESADYHNAVFVGYDKNGEPKHASVRGTSTSSAYRGNAPNSMPEYSFHWHGNSDRLYVFEAPIDMLSYISMHKDNWQEHSYAALCGVGERVLVQMMKDNPNIERVTLCLDNDDAGRKANTRISEKLKENKIECDILVPVHKDWNEDILSQAREQEAAPCPRLQFS